MTPSPSSAPSTDAVAAKHRARITPGLVLALALVIAYAALATLALRFGRPNADEGFYALVSSEVMHGKLLYRDIAYTQTPLLPYLQGVALSVIGFGVFEQRLLNVLLATAALGLTLHLWRKRGLSTSEVLPLASLWIFALPILYYCTIGKTYAMTQLALVVAAAALVLPGRPGIRLLLLSIAGVIAVGCRLPAGPSVAVLWGAFALHHRRTLPLVTLVGMPFALGLLALAPLILPAPGNALYWMWTLHSKVAIPKNPLATLAELGVIAPGIALLALLTVAAVAYRRFRVPIAHLGVFLAGFSGAVLNVVLSGVYAEYAVPFLGLIVLGAGLLVPALGLPRRVVAGGLILGLGITPLSLRQLDDYRSPSAYLAEVEAAATFVAGHTPPQGAILTPMPEIALAAGRPVVPRSEMGKFAITGEMEPTEAFTRHIISYGELLFIVQNRYPAAVVLSTSPRWNFRRSIPSLKWFSDSNIEDFKYTLASHYTRSYANSSFVVYLPSRPSVPEQPHGATLKDTTKTDTGRDR